MAIWATLGVSVARNADEGFKRRKNLKRRKKIAKPPIPDINT